MSDLHEHIDMEAYGVIPAPKGIAEKLSRAAGYISEAIAHPDVPPHIQESMSYTLVRVEAAAKAAREA